MAKRIFAVVFAAAVLLVTHAYVYSAGFDAGAMYVLEELRVILEGSIGTSI